MLEFRELASRQIVRKEIVNGLYLHFFPQKLGNYLISPTLPTSMETKTGNIHVMV